MAVHPLPLYTRPAPSWSNAAAALCLAPLVLQVAAVVAQAMAQAKGDAIIEVAASPAAPDAPLRSQVAAALAGAQLQVEVEEEEEEEEAAPAPAKRGGFFTIGGGRKPAPKAVVVEEVEEEEEEGECAAVHLDWLACYVRPWQCRAQDGGEQSNVLAWHCMQLLQGLQAGTPTRTSLPPSRPLWPAAPCRGGACPREEACLWLWRLWHSQDHGSPAGGGGGGRGGGGGGAGTCPRSQEGCARGGVSTNAACSCYLRSATCRTWLVPDSVRALLCACSAAFVAVPLS